MKSRGGFSLLELMVVVGIIGLVTGVVVASFSGGIRVWESVRSLSNIEQELYFGFESIRKDLFNTYKFHAVSFRGEGREVSFPGLVSESGEGGGTETGIGSVKYVFEPENKVLVRYEWSFPGGEDGARREVVAGGVGLVRFSYMDGAVPGDDSAWAVSWRDPTNFPAAVRVEMTIDGVYGNVVLERHFSLMEALWLND